MRHDWPLVKVNEEGNGYVHRRQVDAQRDKVLVTQWKEQASDNVVSGEVVDK